MSGWQWLALIAGVIFPGAFVSWAAAHWIRRRAAGWGLLDQPSPRKVHAQATPLGGGVAIWLGFVGPLAIGQLALWLWHTGRLGDEMLSSNAPLVEWVRPYLPGMWARSGDLWLLLGLGTGLMLLGLVDDVRNLDWRFRLLVQAAVAGVVVLGRGWRFGIFPDWPWLAATISLLWIVGLVNSFNMLDNMDGLSAGVGTIAAAMLAAVMLLAPDSSTHQPHWFVAGSLLALIGALLGFLWHNRPPARIFMGDAGSYFLGFSLATIALLATYGGDDLPRHAMLAPVCIFAVPLYDSITVTWIRVRTGKSPFQADKNHFSHRLVELGLTRTQAVLTIYLLTGACGLGALLLHEVDQVGAVLIVLLVLCVLVLIGILETAGRKSRSRR